MRVPFVDLRAQYQNHKDEIDAAIRSVIDATSFIGGAPVREFERAYAEACCVSNCVSCANGTDAIYIVLKTLGIGPGDEVITTAHSWISTSEAISQVGASPVFVDVDEYFCLDVSKLERALTGRTRAIMPVHLYGQAAQVEAIAQLCAQRGLHLIEDCAQAHFAERNHRRVGLFGIAGTFSFYPGKNLGAYGDAGAIITNDDEFAVKCRMFANHGALVKHEHVMEGINSRLDAMQAAILSAKLPHLLDWTRERQRIAKRYNESLQDVPGVTTPGVRPGSSHVYHLYVIRCEYRDELKEHLSSKGIETAIHYPSPLPLLPAYARLKMSRGDIPNAARNAAMILSLPIYPEMTNQMVEYVADCIREFYRSKHGGA